MARDAGIMGVFGSLEMSWLFIDRLRRRPGMPAVSGLDTLSPGELEPDSPGISNVVAIGFKKIYHGLNLVTSHAFFLLELSPGSTSSHRKFFKCLVGRVD